ncbi:hypothetical protein SAMN05444745_111134 [Arthrobacter sp. OV608]|nr:hypothetical protein SAMN05444745_111134 [Arthrobacter sp. OV608]
MILVNVACARGLISNIGLGFGTDMQAKGRASVRLVDRAQVRAANLPGQFTSIDLKGRLIVQVLEIHSGPSALQAAVYRPVVIPVGKFPLVSLQSAAGETRT